MFIVGAFITQLNPTDGKEYVCAFASAGLTPAQRNYPPVGLEALAFIFVLSKFYDWLEINEFVWRTDARAHKYIMDNKLSPNQVLARYFVGLQAFRFTVEWIPGLKMIADPLFRMVLVGDGNLDVAITTKSLVFGNDLSLRLSGRSEVPVNCALFSLGACQFPCDVNDAGVRTPF